MDLEVVGRHALLLDDDASATFVNSKEALVEWHSLFIDRYDVQQLLSGPPPPQGRRRPPSLLPDASVEPDLDRERYLDLPPPSDEQGQGRQSKRRRKRRCHQQQQQQQKLLNRERHELGRRKKLLKGKRHNSERLRVKRCQYQLGGGQSSSSSSSSSSAASKFMSVVTDDVLLEIFLRLPHSRFVIVCGAVCKRWFSLVSSRSQGSLYFIHKFNYHHRLKRHQQQKQDQADEQLPFTLLLRGFFGTWDVEQSEYYRPTLVYRDILFDKSKILHYGTVSSEFEVDYLGFFPWPRGHIVSSIEDLLLIRVTDQNFCICNPLTRQWILLPNNPVDLSLESRRIYRCGLVCKSNCTCPSQFGGVQEQGQGSNDSHSYFYCNCSVKYRVALISAREYGLQGTVFTLSVFSSESGQWTQSTIRFEINLNKWCKTPVVNNGIIYWALENENNVFSGVVAFDPFKDDSEAEEQQCRLISLPLEFARGKAYGRSGKAHLGVVRGRLRLAQFYFFKRSESYFLKVWELDDDHHNNDASWDLVHHVRIQRNDKSVKLALAALHPEDGDMFFLTCIPPPDIFRAEINIFQYKIGSRSDDVELVCRCTNVSYVCHLVYPRWPTSIPSLPSFA